MLQRLLSPVLQWAPQGIKDLYYGHQASKELDQWELNGGSGVPVPHLIKQRIIERYRQQSGAKVLIETGTAFGAMVRAQLGKFERIHSVELSEVLWRKAVARFKDHGHVSIHQGDSGKVLADLVPKLDATALFFLDGHYSAGVTARGDVDCPIDAELASILVSPYPHVLLIDDARLFVGRNDYPTLDALRETILAKRPGSSFEVELDMIRVVLK